MWTVDTVVVMTRLRCFYVLQQNGDGGVAALDWWESNDKRFPSISAVA